MAGFPLFVVRQKDEIEYYQNEIEQMLRSAINSIELKDKGVYVQASTLGSLEAFLQLLRTHHIPVILSLYNSPSNL
jgi:translation initiation factor 5B